MVRLDSEDVVLTRIDPAKRETSMLFRIRPHWRAVWPQLSGLLGPGGEVVAAAPPSPKLKYEVYVCTAAKRDYALEAWRVLDWGGWMVPTSERELRRRGRCAWLPAAALNAERSSGAAGCGAL